MVNETLKLQIYFVDRAQSSVYYRVAASVVARSGALDPINHRLID